MNIDDFPSIDDLVDSPLDRFIYFTENICGYAGPACDLMVEWLNTMFLKAKYLAGNEDKLKWWKCMSGPFSDEYWKSACTEIETLERMGVWGVFERDDDMNVIEYNCKSKIKLFADGLMKIFKAWFCARCDHQLEGDNLFETYAPIMQWKIICIILILEVVLGIKSKK